MTLQDIYVYPIKSLGGIRLNEAEVEERGLKYDRRWMLVDKNGVFFTQRRNENMALIQVELERDGLLVYLKRDPAIRISVPFSLRSAKELSVEIWEDKVNAQIVDVGISAWFTKQLGMPCDLVVMPESSERKLPSKYTSKGETVSFADSMPYLIIGQSALDDLNVRLKEQVPMVRFRPNFVFSGGDPFAEDDGSIVSIGECTFKITKPCARCIMVTIDQDSGIKGKEPLKTLATYRLKDNKILFGQNLILLTGDKVKIGDKVLIK